MTEINVTGLKELAQFLDELPTKLQKNVVRGAMRAGLKPVLVDAKAGAAFATGALRDGLKISTASKGGVVTGSIKAKGEHGFLAQFVEYGTGASRTKALLKPRRKWPANRPGQPARPFMRPALDSQATAAVVAAAEYMKDRLATKHGLDTADVLIEGDDA
jgi:HK97 gp10 family phage protein